MAYRDIEAVKAEGPTTGDLAAHGFDPVVRYGSFPMEFFLLGGFDYTTDPSKGASAHHS
ncbi:MAG: hypothetical protein ACO3VI_08405 [Ilumatobacteraceae bacterium]